MPLPRAHLLDELATAYVQAAVALAGATISVSRRDYGVDGQIRQVGSTSEGKYFETGYSVDFQLKGTTVADVSNTVRYDLRVRNFNLIVTRPPQRIPYYLFLVCFGANLEEWGAMDDEGLMLLASAYWWTDFRTRSENMASVRIEIPIANRLTSNVIADMLRSSETRLST
jgi:uncharacterized protein DUF4365